MIAWCSTGGICEHACTTHHSKPHCSGKRKAPAERPPPSSAKRRKEIYLSQNPGTPSEGFGLPVPQPTPKGAKKAGGEGGKRATRGIKKECEMTTSQAAAANDVLARVPKGYKYVPADQLEGKSKGG